jgi:hypothetical protein
LNKIYAAGGFLDGDTWLNKNSVSAENTPEFGFDSTRDIDQFAMYYGLLSDTSGWKKAMPQAGLQMKGLVPLTWSILATQGQPNVSAYPSNQFWYPDDGTKDGKISVHNAAIGRYMRGDTRRMPAVDTMVMTSDGHFDNNSSAGVVPADNSGSSPTVGDIIGGFPAESGQEYSNLIVPNLDLPNCFVAAVVLPPAKLNRLYYRLKVTWNVEFSQPRPLTDLTNWFGLANAGVMSYGSDYLTQSTLITKGKDANKQGMVDAGDMEITKVMEGSK